MLHLLDTDVVSNLRKLEPNPLLLRWLADTPLESLCIPLVVIFEIQMGVEKLRREGKAELADDIERWLDDLVHAMGENILVPGTDVIRLQARMFAEPGLRHFLAAAPNSPKLKFGADLTIAAMAIVHEMPVVTFNIADYEAIHRLYPLPGLFHPGRGEWVIAPPRAPTPGPAA